MQRCRWGLLLVGVLAAITPAPGGASEVIVVSPADMHGWQIVNFDASAGRETSSPTTSGTFGELVSGPRTPPLGTGSYHQRMGSDGRDGQSLRTSRYNGTPLVALQRLSFHTFVAPTSPTTTEATMAALAVDLDGDGRWNPSADDVIVLEPHRQRLDDCPSDCVVKGFWQGPWEGGAAEGGLWRSTVRLQPPQPVTLAGYALMHPGAALATDVPSLALAAGFEPRWARFDGYADRLAVNDTLRDFEGPPPATPTPPPPTATPPPTTPTPAPTPTPTPLPTPPPCDADRTPYVSVGGFYYVWTDGVWQESNGLPGLQRRECTGPQGQRVARDIRLVP